MTDPRDSEGLPADWVLHHVGVATRDAAAEVPQWAPLGYAPCSSLVHDPIQKVRVLFLSSAAASTPLIELVEPAAEDAPVHRYLASGPRFYHLCFEVPDLEAALARVKRNRWLVVRKPEPATAFGGRRIAWCYTATRDLIELVER